MSENDTFTAMLKIAAAWIGAAVGHFVAHLGDLVLFSTLIYTVLQTYVLMRDRLRKGPP
jgi:fibrillarin-like rRNA methylase